MTSPAPAATESSSSTLRHVLTVGGTLAEWDALTGDEWETLAGELGAACSEVGVPWLTLRPYESGDAPARDRSEWNRVVGTCTVIVDPSSDGRQRFADALVELPADEEVNEATVAAALYEPADSEPDLVVVLGQPTQLPPSLVWELAYAELVFTPVAFPRLDRSVIDAAFDEFGQRRRRFGGLDE